MMGIFEAECPYCKAKVYACTEEDAKEQYENHWRKKHLLEDEIEDILDRVLKSDVTSTDL